MWVPRWVKYIANSIEGEVGTVHESFKELESAIHHATETNEQKEREIGIIVAGAIERAASTVPEYEKCQRKKEHSLQWKLFWVTLFAAIAAAGAAIGAFVYAGIANRQLQTMSNTYTEIQKQTQSAECSARAATKSADTAAKDLVLTERPWIEVIEQPGVFQEFNKPTMFEVHVTNNGKTPARHFIGSVWLEYLKGTEKVRRAPHINVGPQILIPGVPLDIQATLFEVPAPGSTVTKPVLFTPDMANAINKGTAYLMVTGRFEYDDIFGKKHWTHFCFLGRPGTLKRPIKLTEAQEKCQKYNDVDTNY